MNQEIKRVSIFLALVIGLSVFLYGCVGEAPPKNITNVTNGTPTTNVTAANTTANVTAANETEGPPAQTKACWWVFKTNGDYSDLQLIINFDKNRPAHIDGLVPGIDVPNIGIHTGGSNPLYKLDQGYIGHVYGCYFPSSSAFANISMSKWKNELMGCVQPLKDYEENLVLKYCNDTKFLWRIEPRMDPVAVEIGVEPNDSSAAWGGQMYARAQTGGDCSFSLSNEERSGFTQQEKNWEDCRSGVGDKYNAESSMNSIIDTKPFTEFYLCDVESIDALNAIINNNELSIKCQKKI